MSYITRARASRRTRRHLLASILSALAILVLGVTMTTAGSLATPAPAAAASCTSSNFKDVPRGSKFYQAVSWVNCKGLHTGYSDRNWRPTWTVSRADFALMLYRQVTPKHVKGQQYFNDVPKGKNYTEAVNWLAQSGLVRGYAGRTFKPSQPITRGDASVILYRLAGSKYAGPATSPFKDVAKGKAFYKETTWMRSQKLNTGYADKTFRPTKNISRGDTAVILKNAHRLIGTRGDVKTAKMTPLPTKVQRASSTTAAWKAKTTTWAKNTAKNTKTYYQYGGNGPLGFDCSGFTTGAFAAGGKTLPRTSKAQYTAANKHVPRSQAQAGDLVYWSNNGKSSGVYHVAVVVDQDTIAHARNAASGVTLTDIDYSTTNMLSSAGRFN